MRFSEQSESLWLPTLLIDKVGCSEDRYSWKTRHFSQHAKVRMFDQDSRYKTQNITTPLKESYSFPSLGAQRVSKLLLEKHLARIIQRVMLYIQAHLYLIISERSHSR